MNTLAKATNPPDASRRTADGLALRLDGALRRFPGGRGMGPLSLQLPWKGVLSLIGPNAGGKTTVLKCIAGFEPLDQGSIEVAGHSMRTSMARDSGRSTKGTLDFDHVVGAVVGIVFQNAEPWPHLRVIDNLLLPLLHGLNLPPQEAYRRAQTELERF